MAVFKPIRWHRFSSFPVERMVGLSSLPKVSVMPSGNDFKPKFGSIDGVRRPRPRNGGPHLNDATRQDQENPLPPAQKIFDELPAEPICVRVPVAVKLTGISRSTLYELIGTGEVEAVKVGRSTFIRYASLKRLFDRE
ncbi:helix-turn-helix domain-containing protein [Sphingopyxis sp. 550A]